MSTYLQTSSKDKPGKLRWLTGLITIEALLLVWWRFLPFFAEFNLANTLWVSEKLTWYLTRSSGAVAYLVLSASTLWGILLSTKLIKEWVPAPVALTMHSTLSWTAVGVAAFHAFVLLFDNYYTFTLSNLLIPFTGPYEPLWVGIGTLSFYLTLLLSTTFYLRRWIGAGRWRQLHYLTFATYGMVTLHGWMAGTDSATFPWLYGGSSLLVLFLTIYRVLTALRPTSQAPQHKLQKVAH